MRSTPSVLRSRAPLLYPPFVRLVSKQARHDIAEPPVLRIALEVSMPMHFEIDLRRAHGRLSDADVHVHALDEHADGMWHRHVGAGLRNDERNAHEVRRPQDDAPMDLLRLQERLEYSECRSRTVHTCMPDTKD